MVGDGLLELKRTDVSWWVITSSPAIRYFMVGDALLVLGRTDVSWWVTACSN